MNEPSPILSIRQALAANDEQISNALAKLDELERDFLPAGSLETKSVLPIDTSELQISELAKLRASESRGGGGIEQVRISPAAMAAHLYSVGRTTNFLHAFRWSKRKAISECLASVRYSIEHQSFLDKSVRGVRNAYEFLSEFAHPNYATYQLGVVSVMLRPHRHGFRMLRKVLSGDTAPQATIDELGPLIRDVLELLIEALEHFLELDAKLAHIQEEVSKRTRIWVRKMIRKKSGAFRDADPCPCLSGKIIAGCCGKLVHHPN